MKLEFTDDFLKRVESITTFFRLDKEKYLDELCHELENASDYDVETAIDEGIFEPDIDWDITAMWAGGACITVRGWYVEKDDCANWDEYWTSRKGQK